MQRFFSAFLVGIMTLISGHSTNSLQNTSVSTSPTPTQQSSYSQDQLAENASSISLNKLSLGDGKYTTTAPKKGYIYLCNVGQGSGGADQIGSWITGTTWDSTKKPEVSGKIAWSNAIFSNTISGSMRIISGNDLPVHSTTGNFPIQSSDPAYQYDQNPNKVIPHTFSDSFPVSPIYSHTPYCMGGEVGIMLNGIPLFNAFDADHRDAPAHELQDSCQGHPQVSGEYHYHSLTHCLSDMRETTVIGFALDGFPITGPEVTIHKYLTTSDLDECHGLTSEIILDGKKTTIYHYVMTQDFPYSASCFRGKPVSLQVISRGQTQGGQNQHPSMRNNQNYAITSVPQQAQQPPQEALSICSGKTTNTSCSFISPQGTIFGTCQTPPYQTFLICVPHNPPR